MQRARAPKESTTSTSKTTTRSSKAEKEPTTSLTTDQQLELFAVIHVQGGESQGGPGGRKRNQHLSDEEFLDQLRTNPAFQHFDLEIELAKMDAWLLTRPRRQKTRRFVVAWLLNIDPPVRQADGPVLPPGLGAVGRRFLERHEGEG